MRIECAAAAIVLLAVCGCREEPVPSIEPGRIVRARAGAERSLLALVPAEARAGEAFEVQPDGRSALAVLGTGLTREDVVRWAGRPLDTAFGNSRLLTAAVPAELLLRPGEVEITVESAADTGPASLRATFRLLPPGGVPARSQTASASAGRPAPHQ